MVTLLMNFSDANGITMLLLGLGYIIFSARSRQCKSNLFSALLPGRTSVLCHNSLCTFVAYHCSRSKKVEVPSLKQLDQIQIHL